MNIFVLIIYLFPLIKEQTTLKKGDTKGLVIEEENSRIPKVIDSSSRQEFLCSYGSSCIPLRQCHIISQLVKSSCAQIDKIRGLTCGYQGTEPLVCCPQMCPGQPNNQASYCGRPQISHWWSTGYSGLGVHPWVVRVGFKNKLLNTVEYLCCGSIINKRTILTAAHCALAKTASHKIVSVRVGEYDCNQDPDCSHGYCAPVSVDIPLNHIIVHPNYNPKTYTDNIALLVVKYPMNYSVSTQPICLYSTNKDYIYAGHSAQLVGWGRLAGQVNAGPTQQQLLLPVLPVDRCLVLYGGSVPITEDHLCVGGEGKDACSGFGGAPLLFLDPRTKSKYYQIGLLSFGSDRCGEEGIPSVYTRVDKYIDWINLNLPKE